MNRLALWFAAILVPFLWLIWAFQRPISRELGMIWRPEIIGLWGDSFGALNALFAAFGFIAVLATLRQQSQELNRQHRDIENAQIDRRKQRFEDHFFQLMGLMRELRSEVTETRYVADGPNSRTVKLEGMDAIKRFSTEIDRTLASPEGKEMSASQLADLYVHDVHKRSEAGLGAYFRIVYTILRRISEEDVLDSRERAQFGNMVRSQLTSHEVALIGLNGLTPASKNFAQYITEFRLLKYLGLPHTLSVLKLHYPAETFQPRD